MIFVHSLHDIKNDSDLDKLEEFESKVQFLISEVSRCISIACLLYTSDAADE